MKKYTKKSIRLTAILYIVAVAAVVIVTDACRHGSQSASLATPVGSVTTAAPLNQGDLQSKVVSILGITASADGTGSTVIFRELEEEFNVTDAGVLASLKTAYTAGKAIKITFNPWQASVVSVPRPAKQSGWPTAPAQL